MTCQRCGATFASKRSDARFCSGRCRVAAHRGSACIDDGLAELVELMTAGEWATRLAVVDMLAR